MEQKKLEEALKTIKEWKETCEKFPDEKMASKYYKWIASIHKVAIECIDKQIPKKTKVEAIEERIFINYCPSCGNEVVGGIRYCADCGQRLEYQWKEKKPSSI